MTAKPSTSFEEEDLLVRFCRMVLDSPQTPELINRLAADAGFVRVSRKIFQDGEERALHRCCRRKHFNENLIRLRLQPVARALRLTPDTGAASSDYYAVLGVAADADRQTIKAAYRQMALRLHPDKRPHDGGELFLALQAAYVHLTDPDLRAQYDRKHPTEKWVETRPPMIHPSRMFRLHRSSWSIAVLSVTLAAAAYGVDLYVQESSLFKEQALLENKTVPEPDQRIVMESALGVFPLAEADGPYTDEAVLKHRLDTFLEEYCAAYSQEDLEKLSALFMPDATEQGQPVSAMLPRHGQYFKEVMHLNCRIRLVSFVRQDRSVALQGEFIESYQTPDGRQSNHFGPIRMELFDTIDRLRIRKLEYGAI